MFTIAEVISSVTDIMAEYPIKRLSIFAFYVDGNAIKKSRINRGFFQTAASHDIKELLLSMGMKENLICRK